MGFIPGLPFGTEKLVPQGVLIHLFLKRALFWWNIRNEHIFFQVHFEACLALVNHTCCFSSHLASLGLTFVCLRHSRGNVTRTLFSSKLPAWVTSQLFGWCCMLQDCDGCQLQPMDLGKSFSRRHLRGIEFDVWMPMHRWERPRKCSCVCAFCFWSSAFPFVEQTRLSTTALAQRHLI